MILLRKFITFVITFQFLALPIAFSEAGIVNNNGIDGLRGQLEAAEGALKQHRVYFADENGREIDLFSLVQRGVPAPDIRLIIPHDNGESYGLRMRGGHADLSTKTMGVHIALYDSEFNTRYAFRSITLDLDDNDNVDNKSKLVETAIFLEGEIAKKLSGVAPFSNPLKSILEIIMPTAHAHTHFPGKKISHFLELFTVTH